jgi:outer membrane protein assembly factor BamA
MLLAVPEYLWAQECNPDGEVVDGMRIVDISIDNENIFDLEQEQENLWIHRWANKLHIKTRKKIIEDQLLFELQDEYNQELVTETERLLRSRGYIHDAEVTAQEVCGEGVRLNVTTTDNWTLSPRISASKSGGETRTSIQIEESNLWAMGLNCRCFQSRTRTGIPTQSFSGIRTGLEISRL